MQQFQLRDIGVLKLVDQNMFVALLEGSRLRASFRNSATVPVISVPNEKYFFSRSSSSLALYARAISFCSATFSARSW